MEEYNGRYKRCVIALDAPLECRARANQQPRVKAAEAGTATGAERRQCEEAIQQYKVLVTDDNERAWNSDMIIQSGSPLAPRMISVLEKLTKKCGSMCWGLDRSSHDRQVIEIFPSEAIWSLGLQGGFPDLEPCEVRSYKKKKPSSLVREAALLSAMKPLLGFDECLGSQCGLRCAAGVNKPPTTHVSLPLTEGTARWCEKAKASMIR